MIKGPSNAHHFATDILLRAGKSLPASLAIVLPVAVLLPAQIYNSNAYDFNLAFTELFFHLLLAGLGFVVVLAVVLSLLPGRWHCRFVALTIGLAIVMWVQGQLLVWNYGVLDGSVPDWDRFLHSTIVDSMAWLVILGLALAYNRLVYSQAIVVALALITIQAVPVALDWRDEPDIPNFHRFQFDEAHKFSFSQRENVIFLMLDAFQADIYHDILRGEPALAESFEGFTYFRNALAGYSKTYPSVALMMGGRWYANERPIQDFIKRSFERNSLPAVLRRAGWRVDLFPHVKRVVHVSPNIASNVRSSFDCATLRAEAGQLLDLGLFRASPHWLKPFWLNDYDWQFSRVLPALCESPEDSKRMSKSINSGAQRNESPHAAIRFIEDARSLARAELAVNSFKFYHLMIPHAPFNLDENLSMTRLPRGAEGFRRHSRSTVELIERFLDVLKASGVYYDAMIVIVSDHGGGEYVNRVNLDGLPDHLVSDSSPDNSGVPGKHLASGLPLMLVKRPGEQGSLTISDAPVSLGDMAATIARAIGLEHDYPGRDIYELSEDEMRSRRYLFFEFDGWRSSYLPEMVEYTVEGFSWDPANWRRSGRAFPAREGRTESRLVEVPVNRQFGFLPASRMTRALARGWSEPKESGLVWSEEPRAVMEMSLPDNAGRPHKVFFDIMPFLARGAIESASIRVRVNGELAGEWEVKGRGWQSVGIPEELAGEEELVLDFEFPDADAPINYGYSLDRRTLGMALYRMRIEAHES